MNEKIISLVKRYLICFAVMGTFTVGILSSVGYSAEHPLSVKFLNLSDAFFVPGIVVFLVGVLVWVSTTGFFDSIAYVVNIGFRALVPFMRRGEYEKYYDYKLRKGEKRIKGYGFILISGLVYLLIGAIFAILFFTV